MSVKKYGRIENFEQLNDFIQDFYNNIGIEDLKGTGIRTEEPTTDTLDKGRSVIVELSGVPYLYYRTLDGTIYKKQMDAV